MKTLCFVLFAASGFAQTSLYPGALDTDSTLFITADNVQTTLNVAMATTDNVAIVRSGTGFVNNMIVTICDVTAAVATGVTKCTAWEHMLITAANGQSLTVTRGVAGTSARSHATGAVISALIDAAHQQSLKAAILSLETALGANLNGADPGPNWTAFSTDWADLSRNVNNYPNSSLFANNGMAVPNAIRGAINIPANSLGSSHGAGVAGYALTNSPNLASIGLFGIAFAGSTGFGGATGINTVVSNCITQVCANGGGFQSSKTVAGAEFDMNLMKIGSSLYTGAAYGIVLTGGAEAQPAGDFDAIHVFQAGAFAGTPWKYLLKTDIGAATHGIYLSAKASGNSQASQDLTFAATDGGGITRVASIVLDQAGTLDLIPTNSANAAVQLYDSNLNQIAAAITGPSASQDYFYAQQQFRLQSVAFASLPIPVAAGAEVYCNNCTTAGTCAAGGSGHVAVWNGSIWACQ